MKKKKLNSVLIKPSGPDCNIECAYCFYLEKAGMFPENSEHRMSIPILEETIKQSLENSSCLVSYAWQGGEPTLSGLQFFEKAVEFQKKYGEGKSVGNGLQTNGLLINNKWVKFLKQYNFLVGLSLDGPEHIHDHYRKSKTGKGTWALVEKNARMMLKAGVDVNALSVINDYSVKYPHEIYNYFKFAGLNYMQFIPCFEQDKTNKGNAVPFSVSAEDYGNYLKTIFDLWYDDIKDDVASTSVRYFDSVFHTYAGLKAPDCTLESECGTYIVVEHNGDVFSCDFFVEERWKLGNILSGNLEDMLNSPVQNKFGEQKSYLPDECCRCRWLNKCRGGCTKDRIMGTEANGLNYFCTSFKMFFEHADERLTLLSDNWKIQNK